MKVKRIDGLHLPHRDGDPMTNFLQENEGLAFNVDHAQMDGWIKKINPSS
jgi:hypothetical protein